MAYTKPSEHRREYCRKWYRKNRKKHQKNVRCRNYKYRSEDVQYIRSLKNVPCADCGERYPYYVMDFDHVRGKKLFSIGSRMGRYHRKTLQREIDKCDVVCANCHRKRTHLRRLS